MFSTWHKTHVRTAFLTLFFLIGLTFILSACRGRPSVTGKWELLGDEGDCLYGADAIEFFPDGKYVVINGFWDDLSQYGGSYSILDESRMRLEAPMVGHVVCEFVVKENTLLLTGPGMQTSRYVRYEEFPQEDYPSAIIGEWKHVTGDAEACLVGPFELYSTPDKLTLAPDSAFVVEDYESWYGQYVVLGTELLMTGPSIRPTPTPQPSADTSDVDLLFELLGALFSLGDGSEEQVEPFDGTTQCQIQRITQAQLVLSDSRGSHAVYRRTMTEEDMLKAAGATATAIALLPPTSTPTPTATPTPTPPMLSVIPFDYRVEDIGDGWKKGTVRLAFENLSDRPAPPQCLIFQEQKEDSPGWLQSPCEQAFQVVITNVYIETQEGKTYQAAPSSAEIRLGAVGGDVRFTIPPGFPFQNVYSGYGIRFDTISFQFAQAAHPNRLVLQREESDFVFDLASVPQTIPTPDLSRYTVKPINELGKQPIVDIPGKVRFTFDGQCYHQEISGFYRKGITLPWTLVNYNQFDTEQVNPDFSYAVYYPGGLLEYYELLSFEWGVGPGQTERYAEIILDEDLGDGEVAATHMIVFEPGEGLTVYEFNCEER